MSRIKSIDIFRGLSILWMVVAHLLDWWLIVGDRWLFNLMFSIFDVMGAGAFLFISGVSTVLSHRNWQLRVELSGTINKRMARNQFLFRGSLLLIVALLYNVPIAIYTQKPFDIWIWYVLLTIGVSILFSWPFIKIPKSFRIIFAIIILIVNQILLGILLPHQYESNILGIFFHILYNGYPVMDPILNFFPFFLIGTVIGDLIFEISLYQNEKNRKNLIKTHLLIPSLIIGTIWMLFGILFKFPSFLTTRTFSWTLYSAGIHVLLISVMIYIEETKLNNIQKSYKFLFYFSYYSLTIFLAHNLLFFIFLKRLSASVILFFIVGTIILLGLLLRFSYFKFGPKLSLKSWINFLSTKLAQKIENSCPSMN